MHGIRLFANLIEVRPQVLLANDLKTREQMQTQMRSGVKVGTQLPEKTAFKFHGCDRTLAGITLSKHSAAAQVSLAFFDDALPCINQRVYRDERQLATHAHAEAAHAALTQLDASDQDRLRRERKR